MRKDLIVVRGGGDIASGVIHKLHRCGFPVLALETERPSAIRRKAAFSEAVYDGVSQVEGVACTLAAGLPQAEGILSRGEVAMLVDPQARCLRQLSPMALVDAILAKRNLGTHAAMAPLTVALGPGFTAPADVHVVVETMRGHNLGRLIYSGSALPNTGVPGLIAGVGAQRVVRAPAAGILRGVKQIASLVSQGEAIAFIDTERGEAIPVPAPIGGLLRGLLPSGFPVTAGFKVADVDPRPEQRENCFTISDKSRCIAGGVLEAVMRHLSRQG